ncbi:MAG: YDG domain-containing protein, partial [Candidatus Omnitrophota bacterium]
NTVTRNINADHIGYDNGEDYEGGYFDYSYNEAYLDIQDTLDTSSEGGDSVGSVTLTAYNTVDNTFNIDSYISQYYSYPEYSDYSNYSKISDQSLYTIYTDSGDVTLTSKNDITHNIITGYIDYFYDETYNEADLYLYTPIYSQTGNIKLEAYNNLTSNLTAPALYETSIEQYEDYTYNYSYIQVNDTISTQGHAVEGATEGIDISSYNSFNRTVTADYIGTFTYEPYNEAYTNIYGDTTTAQIYNGEELVDVDESNGKVNIAAYNNITNNVTVNNEPYEYNDNSYNNSEINISNTISTDLGNITLISDDINLNGTLESNAVIDINVTGDFNNSLGTIIGSTDITFTNAFEASYIYGSNTFRNFTCEEAGKTLNFEYDQTQTINGTLTITGTDEDNITLASTSSGTQWYIDVSGASGVNISYATVSDSNALSTIAPVNSTDNGNNNENWIFASPYLTITVDSSNSIAIDAGASYEITITAYDRDGNFDSTYTGDKSLKFSGLSDAPNGTIPAIDGVDIHDGDNNLVYITINFADGETTVTLVAYKAETASLDVIDDGNEISSLNNIDYDLDLTVSPDIIDHLTITTEPVNTTYGEDITVIGEIRDQFDNLRDTDTATISIDFTDNPTEAYLDGTLSKDAEAGVVTFDDLRISKVGTGYTLSLSGSDLVGAETTSFNIIARPITVTAVTDTKVYDRNTDSTGTPTITEGSLVDGDTVTWIQTFDSKNAGTEKALTPSGTIDDGNSGNNYDITFINDTTGVIETKAITVDGIAANNKEYDQLTTATLDIDGASLVGIIEGDDVALNSDSAIGAFSDKNAAEGKDVTVSGLTINGADTGNYTLTQPEGITADITQKALTVSGAGAENKVYDGNTDAALVGEDVVLVGVIEGDDVALNGEEAVGTFSDKNVGEGKDVNVSGLSLEGDDALNYSLIVPVLTADITPKLITVTANASQTKIYGELDPEFTYIGDELVGADSYSGDLSRTDGENVGTYAIGQGALTAGGNYEITFISDNFTITPKPITVTAVADTKVYGDGDPVFTYTGDELIGSDSYSGSLSRTTGEDVGTYAIEQGTLTAGGNYEITYSGADFTVTQKPITVTATIDTKPYDGTVDSIGIPEIIEGSLVGDDTATWTQAFDTKDAGDKTLTPSGTIEDGNSGNNYEVSFVPVSGAITQKTLTVTATGIDKVYDRTTDAEAILSSDDIVEDDVVAFGYSASFSDWYVDTGKTVSVSSISIDGADSGNYTLGNTEASTIANITQKALIVTGIAADNKVYDGTEDAVINVGEAILNGVIGGDTVTLSTLGATGAFSDKNVGEGKTVTISGITIDGDDALNYELGVTGATATADITPKTLTVTAEGINKVYDRNTDAEVTLLDDRIEGDALSFSYSASFSDKNVDDGKTVTVSGISIDGDDAGNYELAGTTTSTIADITERSLTITATGVNKVYDDTTDAEVILLDDRIEGDDIVASYTTAEFDTKDIGDGKTITVSGISISGADAGNYTFNTTAATIANITSDAVDETSPDAPGDLDSSTHTVDTWSNDNEVTITWSVAADPGDPSSGVDGYSYEWSASIDTVPDQVKDVEEDITSLSSTLSDGIGHYFHIRTVDEAGNWSETSTIGPFKIDTVAPMITATPDRSANANSWYNNDVTVSFTATDTLSGVDSVSAPITLNLEVIDQSASGTATDLAGNSTSVTLNNINIDKTAPTINITKPPIDGITYTSSQTLLYTVSDNIDPNPGVTGDVSGTVYDTTGSYNVSVEATDLAGNSSSQSMAFKIDLEINTNLVSDAISLAAFNNISVTIVGYTVSSFNSAPTFYFYHPLTPIDSAAIDSITLDMDAYEFIEGMLRLKGISPSYFGIQ